MTHSGPGPLRPGAPLFVDLDGTLVRTDLLYESFLDRFKRDWALPVRAVGWLAQGTAALKTRLAEGRVVAVEALPFHPAVIDLVRAARADGRAVFLATASHLILARQVADHLDLFDGVIATERGRNVDGAAKLARLRELTGSDQFEYLGNSAADIPIWEASARAGVVAPDFAARRWMGRNPGKSHAVGEQPSVRASWAARLRLLRPCRWLENLLLLLPLVDARQPLDLASGGRVALAFVALTLCASAGHVIDDLLDVEPDRLHPRKRDRPFASGAVPLLFGFQAAPVLLSAATLVGVAVSWPFVGMLVACVLVELAYSLGLKRRAAIGIVTLAALDLMRIAAGAVALDVVPSTWLLAFAPVLCLGLALARRRADAGRP